MFPPQFLDEIRARVALAETVGRRVRLQRRGREHVGLCPFHNEKTPSFTLNEDKGFFHCFGCGAHGDVIGFVMRTEGLSFPEAVERLAEQAGLQVPETSPAERERAVRQQTLGTVLEAACVWYEKQLKDRAGREARDYLRGRGLTDETITRFRLGYAPDSRHALKGALAQQKVEESLAIEAGLLRRPEGGGDSYDYFRGRILFPISDARGRIIAFGGRVMGDGQPKYLNSPETPLFRKGAVLFGLAQAREAARAKREIVVAEGYMDVIALHQAGISHAVAPLGTALTEAQIELLWRLAPEPVLCFDGDEAGRRAMNRAADRALPILRPGCSLRFASLPPGEDPDSLIRASGAPQMERVLERARPLKDVIWDMETAGRPADTPERRAEIRRLVLERVNRIAERSVQRYYLDEMEGRLEEAFGRRKAQKGQGWVGRARATGPGQARPAQARPTGLTSQGDVDRLIQRFEMAFLAALVRQPELLDELGEPLGARTFGWAELDRLRQAIVGAVGLDTATLQIHLREQGFSGLLDRVLSRDVYEAAPFAGPEKGFVERREEWLEAWARFWRREAHTEISVDAQALGDDLTPERWARFVAKKRQYGEFDERAEGRDDLPVPAGNTHS
ncbi:MAG: DNA primase [Alphaproteobacteria bacterium]